MPVADLVKSNSGHIELQELLTSPVSVLLGVSDAAEKALDDVGIRTVFDLGASWLFANARAATGAAASEARTGRLGMVPTDWLQPGASWESLDQLGELPLAQLRGVTAPVAAALSTALGVTTIREFALWAPHQAARSIVGDTVGSTGDPDELQTEKLRPRFGEYPTERVYYSTLVMLQMHFDGERAALDKPVSLKSTLANGGGFTRPAIGALLTLSQSWYAQGITLGHMLHSLALAPGEATRIAIIDWSRRTKASVSETTTETEQLDDSTQHARAVSEVQSAVANEFQQGGSTSSSQSSSESSSGQASVGTGLLTSLWASGDVSGTTESASTQASAQSSSWSLGNRSVTANMAQNVNDRTEQHASSVRNRRASSVREVAQSEHEEVSTRIVANYNHMHALTVQYYEVVQVYRLATQVHRAERCLFVPLAPVDFAADDAMEFVEKFRGALVRAALTPRARNLLLDTATAVALKPEAAIRVASFRPDLVKSLAATSVLKAASILSATKVVADEPAVKTLAAAAYAAPLTTKVWNAAELATVSRYVARPVLRAGSDAIHLPDDTDLLGVSFSGVSVRRIQLDRIGVAAVDDTFDVPGDSARLDLPAPVRLVELGKIFVAKSGDASASGSMTLECSYLGRRFSTPAIPLELGSGTALQPVLSMSTDEQDRQRELLAHLRANQTHYSQVIFRSLDSSMIVSLLSQFDWNGRPLADQVEPRPLTVAGNYLVLRAPIDDNEDSGIVEGQQAMTWSQLLETRGIDFKETDPRLVPIPTAGVFAEAVLGRSNSAEKLDLTRFWNWQESPIPLSPTEIAPVGTGSRATPEDLKTANLGQPVLNIVNPTSLPAPAGVGAVLDAVSNGAMFRDMSGLAGTQGLVRAGMEGTLQAATDAGQIASANMRTEAQKSVAMGQIAADIVKSMMGGGASGGGATQGISAEGARINHARSMDERGVPVPSGAPGKGSSTPGDGSTGGGDASGAGPDSGGSRSDSSAPASFEGSTFTKTVQGIDPTTTANSVTATKPMLGFALDGGLTDGGDAGSTGGQSKELPALPAPKPLAFPPVETPTLPANHPALPASCPANVFFGDPPTRKQVTKGIVLSATEAQQRQNDIIKAIAAAKADRPLSTANLQHWLSGTGSELVMATADFLKVDSEVPSFLAGTARTKFEAGITDRLKNKNHSQGTLLPATLTPGAKGPVRFMQYRDGVRPSATATPHSADMFTALGSYNVHCAVWAQATFIKHEGGVGPIGPIGAIGGSDVFEVEFLRWCVQIYDVYDWNMSSVAGIGASTPFAVSDADLAKIPLPPGATTVRPIGAGVNMVSIKDQYFRDLEVSGIGRAFLIRSDPFSPVASVLAKFTVKV